MAADTPALVNDPASPHIVVVGAGLSGLTTAFYLHRDLPRARLSILEASPRVGGVVQTETADGFLIEHGADMFSTEPPEALQLCRDLGVEQELILTNESGRGAMIARGHQVYPVPEGFVLMRPTRTGPILSTPLLSAKGKLRLLGERWVAARDSEEDESVASFVERRLGREVLERIVQPLVGGIYTADPRRLSMQATMPQFVAMEREHGSLAAATTARHRAGGDGRERSSSGARYAQFRGFPGGMRQWFERLQAALPDGCVQTSAKLDSLSPAAGRWQLRVAGGDRSSRPENIDADAVVLAGPAKMSSGLLEGFAPAATEALRDIAAASSVILVLGVADKNIARKPKAFGLVVPARERRSILACSFASHKFPGRAPEGHTLMRVFMGGALQPELCERSDEELIELARSDLQELIGWNGQARLQRVVRWNDAMPQYLLGHRQRVERIEAALEPYPTLAIAGNSLHGVGIAPVVRTAKRTAKRVVAAVVG